MRYPDCQRADGDCTVCSISSYGRDCHNCPINQLAYLRQRRGLTQQALANASGVNIRQIQRVENGTSSAGNITLRNAIALSDALKIDIRELIENK